MKSANKEIFKRIENATKNKKSLIHITDKSKLSVEDKIKINLCRHFTQFAVEKKLKLKEFSSISGLEISRLSEIMNYKITKFTVDQLIKNLSILADKDLKIKEYLIFLEQASSMPLLKVAETKKLTKDLRAASENHASNF